LAFAFFVSDGHADEVEKVVDFPSVSAVSLGNLKKGTWGSKCISYLLHRFTGNFCSNGKRK